MYIYIYIHIYIYIYIYIYLLQKHAADEAAEAPLLGGPEADAQHLLQTINIHKSHHIQMIMHLAENKHR